MIKLKSYDKPFIGNLGRSSLYGSYTRLPGWRTAMDISNASFHAVRDQDRMALDAIKLWYCAEVSDADEIGHKVRPDHISPESHKGRDNHAGDIGGHTKDSRFRGLFKQDDFFPDHDDFKHLKTPFWGYRGLTFRNLYLLYTGK